MKTKNLFARALAAGLAACLIALCGCGGSRDAGEVDRSADSDLPAPEPPDPPTDRPIEYTVQGLEEPGGFVFLVVSSPEGVQEIDLPLDTNGTFTTEAACTSCPWPTGRFPLDAHYRILEISHPSDSQQRCRTEPELLALTSIEAPVTINCGGTPIRYSVEGLEGAGGSVFVHVTHPEIGVREMELPLAENGTFSTEDLDCSSCLWASGRFPPGATYRPVAIEHPTDPHQRCRMEPELLELTPALETTLVIDCTSEPIRYSVEGLEGTGGELTVIVTHAEIGVEEIDVPLVANGSFTTETRACAGECLYRTGRFPHDARYRAIMYRHPAEPTQLCTPEPSGSATINTPLQLTCGAATIGYTVEGVLGTGLTVSLATAELTDDEPVLTVVETDEVGEDGTYVFDTALAPGAPYDVTVSQQPRNPDQSCTVANGTGTVEEILTTVEVSCPQPHRYYRFDDSYTMWRAVPTILQDPDDPEPPLSPLEDGERFEGVLHEEFDFERGPAVTLGETAGFGDEDLFVTYLDAPGGQGVVHSSETGKTFWLAVESPQGVLRPDSTGTVYLQSQYASLETAWAFRVVGQPSFNLELTHIRLLAVDAHDGRRGGALRAGVDLRVRAFLLRGAAGSEAEDEDSAAELFFETHGNIDLVAEAEPLAEECDFGCPPIVTQWSLQPSVHADALTALWRTDEEGNLLIDEFQLDTYPATPFIDVGHASLLAPIGIDIDLSGLPLGAEILVLSEARVMGRNSYSPEGGAAAYLRDPASFGPDAPQGGVTVETSGLDLIRIDEQPSLEDLRAITPPLPPPCDAGVERSLLEFDATSYLVSESPEAGGPVRVTRRGSLEGSVAARVRLAAGSAAEEDDYEARDVVVRFGDGSAGTRTVELPIIDDAVFETDEQLTLTLVDPEGCADIGARATADVTIVDDDDLTPGTVAFGSASFEVDEDAWSAAVSLVRTGGSAGTIEVTVAGADGTAGAGSDYTAVDAAVTFLDGDLGPHEILVPIMNDLVIEPNETVRLTLSGASSVVGDPATAVLTIVDDDQNQASTVQLQAAEITAAEADGSASVVMTRYGDIGQPASVTLRTRDGTAVAGEDYEALDVVVSFAAGEATQTFEITLLPTAEAEADETLILELSAPSGLSLGTPATAELVIADGDGTGWGEWLPDIEIDASAGAANGARVAFDGTGNALAIWSQEAANRTDIWSNYFQAGVGWDTAILVEGNDADRFAGSPRVAFDAAGNALSVWTQTDASTGNASGWANRFVPGLGWDAPVPLEQDSNEVVGEVELAVHGSGNAVAVWTQFDGTRMNVLANRYEAESGWMGVETVDELDELVDKPDVAIDASGDVLVVWQQSATGVVWNVMARRFTEANGWELARHVSTTNVGQATSPQAAFDGAGNAFVLWLQNSGFDRAVYAARYTPADGWLDPQMIGSGPGAEQHGLDVDSAGNALAIWRRAETVSGTVVLTAFVSRFEPAAGWLPAEPISTGDVFYPKAALTPAGHALAAWTELDATLPIGTGYSIQSNRFTSGSGWGTPALIGSSGGLIGTGMPSLAVGPSGEAFAIWTRGGEVRANRFE